MQHTAFQIIELFIRDRNLRRSMAAASFGISRSANRRNRWLRASATKFYKTINNFGPLSGGRSRFSLTGDRRNQSRTEALHNGVLADCRSKAGAGLLRDMSFDLLADKRRLVEPIHSGISVSDRRSGPACAACRDPACIRTADEIATQALGVHPIIVRRALRSASRCCAGAFVPRHLPSPGIG